jgi:hypothetical protein
MLGTKNIMFMEISPEETMGRWYFFTWISRDRTHQMAKFIKTMCGHFHGEIDDKSLKMKVACSFFKKQQQYERGWTSLQRSQFQTCEPTRSQRAFDPARQLQFMLMAGWKYKSGQTNFKNVPKYILKKNHVESSNVNPFWLASGNQTLGLPENPPAIVRRHSQRTKTS